MKRCLIIFAKEPQKGRVKTRLKGFLSPAQRLDLYKTFLKDTLELAKGIKCEEKILAYDFKGKNPAYLAKIGRSFVLYRQRGRNLGARMHNAFEFASRNNASKTVIIGSDSPTLPPDYVNISFNKLDNTDMVLGPSYDGGYYLIGLKSPCFELFKGIKWSSKMVLRQTLKRAKKLGKKTVLLNKWYDVDDLRAFARLKGDLGKIKNRNIAAWTRGFLSA